jgi:CBS domain-containing protein
MTTNVITVDPDMSVHAVAQLLSDRGISGVPVVDAANRLVGIVSEGDLLHRVETGMERRPQRPTGRRSSWWLNTIGSPQELARDYLKSHGRTAGDVMTREVVSVADTTELADVAMLIGDQEDQARAGPQRWQARRYRQQSEPRASLGGNEERPRNRRGQR